jgi:hypothetical protein
LDGVPKKKKKIPSVKEWETDLKLHLIPGPSSEMEAETRRDWGDKGRDG